MEDLRFEIRAAFEKEQDEHPPAINLRHEVVRAAASQPRHETSRQWLAVAATILIGVLVVVGLMATRHLGRTPAPVQQPFGYDYGPPPAGVALFYVADPAHPGWYFAFDWSANARGTVKLAQPLDNTSNLVQSPDGSGFIVTGAKGSAGTGGQTLDRLGKPQLNVGVPSGIDTLVWADDNRHLCSLAYQRGTWILSWHVPTFTYMTPFVVPGDIQQGALRIVACSFATDPRAVVTESNGAGLTDLWVVHLTDGKVLFHEKVGGGVASIAASHDSSLIAENSQKSVGYKGESASTTNVRDLATGKITPLDASLEVLAFSGDDRYALVATSPWVEGRATVLGVVDLTTGTVIWSLDDNSELVDFRVQPGGDGFALFLKQPTDQAIHPTIHVYVAHVVIAMRGGFLPNLYSAP
jgi:hypothetical protein